MRIGLVPVFALVAYSTAVWVGDREVAGCEKQQCENTPTTRGCWGRYNTDTNYYITAPDTGRTVEVWLSVEESICNQDGYERPCMTFNGTMPGPPIVADWGDNLRIHVTNNMKSNGTSVHWHGVHLRDSNEWDGVPGVTQCPVAPGESLTYEFKVTQYGTSWYHSHFSLQSSEGLFGPLIFNGPATANYDEDLGALFLQDWSHSPTFTDWDTKQKFGITHSQTTTLINGTNTFDCSIESDVKCMGGGKKFEMVFQQGKKYRVRLINVAIDSQFQFSIDGHRIKVIANDFVPIEPYVADSVIINVGQRYDVIVEANAPPGDYWLRGGWVKSCQGVANDHPESATGIVRYDTASTRDPTSTTSLVAPLTCNDELQSNLVPYLKLDVGRITETTVEDINVRLTHAALFQWTINSSSLVLDWNKPTLKQIFDEEPIFPTPYNVVEVDKKNSGKDEWAVLVIENKATTFFGGIAHPIHFHGHDFWILAQRNTSWDGTSTSFQLKNPVRRDTAVLPAHGYLALAFQLDNPGAWLVHCHIAWHSSMGLALEFVEMRDSISVSMGDWKTFEKTCNAWSAWSRGAPYQQDDSGI
ncbi:multicopper oxidase-domain-containing protein [Aspergillus alliaceus]|uniref:multicopper oxidase-domain-containing protein n=1 Tax=Petromyces alliaceus TaxID=209559 RepID=UPI0012A77759|nr:multicopper oxidase-domain-containing protein [Aspergillus alliaceus]KAB8230045.1 multicopper oxidase-domain-containing protein [Aspergillus alliaceus]